MGYELQVDFDNELRQYGDGVDVGADEVYDCYDDYLSEADVYNAVDFDADGIVNLNEFKLFSVAWLTYDPNHPLCDPNNPNYVSDPNAPGYIDEDDKLRFNPTCDLDEDLHVGLSDIITFSQDWLWIACWKLDEINAAMMTMQTQAQPQSLARSQPLMLESVAVESNRSVAVLDEPAQELTLEPIVMTEEPVIEEEQYEVSPETLTEIIDFLNEVLLTETDNIEGIEQMKAILQEELDAVPAVQEQ